MKSLPRPQLTRALIRPCTDLRVWLWDPPGDTLPSAFWRGHPYNLALSTGARRLGAAPAGRFYPSTPAGLFAFDGELLRVTRDRNSRKRNGGLADKTLIVPTPPVFISHVHGHTLSPARASCAGHDSCITTGQPLRETLLGHWAYIKVYHGPEHWVFRHTPRSHARPALHGPSKVAFLLLQNLF